MGQETQSQQDHQSYEHYLLRVWPQEFTLKHEENGLAVFCPSLGVSQYRGLGPYGRQVVWEKVKARDS